MDESTTFDYLRQFHWRLSCRNHKLDPDTIRLTAECKTVSGDYRTSVLDLSYCFKRTETGEGLELIKSDDGEFRNLKEDVKAGNIEKLHIGDGQYFRAWVRVGSDWKWAQIDLDPYLVNLGGRLVFIMPKPEEPSFWAKIFNSENAEKWSESYFFSQANTGVDTTGDPSLALWGVKELLHKEKNQLDDAKRKWMEGMQADDKYYGRMGS